MFEHIQQGENEPVFQLEESEVNELMEIADDIVGLNSDEAPETIERKDAEQYIHAIALLFFKGGRSFQASVTDESTVTVHIPVRRAGKFIEMLLEEE